jgi:hypothetical protein
MRVFIYIRRDGVELSWSAHIPSKIVTKTHQNLTVPTFIYFEFKSPPSLPASPSQCPSLESCAGAAVSIVCTVILSLFLISSGSSSTG